MAQYATLDLFGFAWYLYEPISTSFQISPEAENWGMKLVLTKMDDIRDVFAVPLSFLRSRQNETEDYESL